MWVSQRSMNRCELHICWKKKHNRETNSLNVCISSNEETHIRVLTITAFYFSLRFKFRVPLAAFQAIISSCIEQRVFFFYKKTSFQFYAKSHIFSCAIFLFRLLSWLCIALQTIHNLWNIFIAFSILYVDPTWSMLTSIYFFLIKT